MSFPWPPVSVYRTAILGLDHCRPHGFLRSFRRVNDRASCFFCSGGMLVDENDRAVQQLPVRDVVSLLFPEQSAEIRIVTNPTRIPEE